MVLFARDITCTPLVSARSLTSTNGDSSNFTNRKLLPIFHMTPKIESVTTVSDLSSDVKVIWCENKSPLNEHSHQTQIIVFINPSRACKEIRKCCLFKTSAAYFELEPLYLNLPFASILCASSEVAG